MCFHKGPMKYGEQIALCSRILLCKSSLIIDTCFATWQGEGWSDMNRNHTIDAADGRIEHLRVPCVCLSVRPQCVSPTSPHLHPLPAEKSWEATWSTWMCHSAMTSALVEAAALQIRLNFPRRRFFLRAPFSNKYVVKEIFCEGYAASLGDEKIMLALCEILR